MKKLKLNLPKFVKNIDYLRWLPWLLMILIFATLVYFSFFINNNYFQTKKHLEKIKQLNEKVSPVIVDIDTYNAIIKNLESKKQLILIEPSAIKNPFTKTFSDLN